MEPPNSRSGSAATAEHVRRAERVPRGRGAYAGPTAILAVSLALTLYGFRATQKSELLRGVGGVTRQTESGGKAQAVLLGGCALTLLSAFCWGFRVGRAPRRQRTLGQPARGLLELEEALRVSEDTLSQILHGTSIPLFVIDRRHVVTHWNQACQNLTGVSAREMIGTRKAWTAFYAAERPVLAELVVDQRPQEDIVTLYGSACRESPALPGAYEFEAAFSNLGDNGKWLFFTAAPVRDGAGSIVGAIETFQDITERERAETALRESEERLHAILELVPAGIIVLDADSHVILQVNPAALRMFGAPEQQILGRECHRYICPAEKGRCPVTDLGASVDNSERTLLSAQKGTVPVLKTVTHLLLNGRRCLLETFVDIAERKGTEEELQRRIEEVSEAKRRLEVMVASMTDREKRMVDLKTEVNDLLQALGRELRYAVPQQVAQLGAQSRRSAVE
jgi:PAS domain S-box-containing protein